MPHPFIPAILDDAELSPAQFRVYCHIARRAGSTGVCYASLQSMSDVTRLKRHTIQEALNTLVKRGMLLETKANRQTRQLTLAKTGPFGTSVEQPAQTGPNGDKQLGRLGTQTGPNGVLQRFSPKVLPSKVLPSPSTSTKSSTSTSTVQEKYPAREVAAWVHEDRRAWVARQPL